MDQSYNAKQLLRLCKKSEIHDLGMTKSLFIQELNNNYDQIINETFSFEIKKTSRFYHTDLLSHKLILRKLNDNLKRLYKDEQSNRRLIISQVKILLEETCPIYILKTDLKSFYDSIDRERLLSKLRDDSMLSYHSLVVLRKLFENPLLAETSGLPWGMALSSTLSEIYMRNFDRWIKRYKGVYFYSRFVDDILVFAYDKKTILELKDKISHFLEKGLSIREDKTHEYNGNDITTKRPLEYLGYKFTTERLKKQKFVNISIATKKTKKIKTRIIKSFLDYSTNGKYNLLENRIKFLTGNYSIKENDDGQDLKAGIFFNYNHVNQLEIFSELDLFYRKVLYSKRIGIGKKLTSLTNSQRLGLSKYSFKAGFEKRIYCKFKYDVLKEITKVWK